MKKEWRKKSQATFFSTPFSCSKSIKFLLIQLGYRTSLTIVLVNSNHVGNGIISVIPPYFKAVNVVVLGGWDNFVILAAKAHLISKTYYYIRTGLVSCRLASCGAAATAASSRSGTATVGSFTTCRTS